MSSIRICAPATDRWRSLLHIILLGYTFVVSAPAFAHMSGASIAAEASSVSASNPSNPATANLTGAQITSGAGASSSVAGLSHEAILDENVGGYAKLFGVTGGAGFSIVTVTNTNNSGSGSLRAAIDGGGNRWIRFTAGLTGTINISSSILMNSANVTLDGRGANVLLQNAGATFALSPRAQNIAIMYIKVDAGNIDGINQFPGSDGLWLHHISFTGGDDDQFSTSNNNGTSHDWHTTISWCKFSQASSFGPILINGVSNHNGDPALITLHHNDISTGSRGPRFTWSRIHEYNNYIHNWSGGYIIGSADGRIYFENNYVNPSGSGNNTVRIQNKGSPGAGGVFALGNVLNGANLESNDPIGNVFHPSDSYSYTAETANTTLRDNIISTAGWRDVPFPE